MVDLIPYKPLLLKNMVTLAPSSTPRVRDSAIEEIEVKLSFFKKKKRVPIIIYIKVLSRFTLYPTEGFEL